jgi:hypothetical protein
LFGSCSCISFKEGLRHWFPHIIHIACHFYYIGILYKNPNYKNVSTRKIPNRSDLYLNICNLLQLEIDMVGNNPHIGKLPNPPKQTNFTKIEPCYQDIDLLQRAIGPLSWEQNPYNKWFTPSSICALHKSKSTMHKVYQVQQMRDSNLPMNTTLYHTKWSLLNGISTQLWGDETQHWKGGPRKLYLTSSQGGSTSQIHAGPPLIKQLTSQPYLNY